MGACAAAGVAAGSALLGATSTAVLADRERIRSVGILRKAPAQITFAAMFNPAELVAWNQVLATFHAKNPGIMVSLLTISPLNWSQYAEKIITLVAGGRPMDIIRIATEGAQLWGAKGLAMPLDPFIKRDAHQLEDYLNDVSPKLMNVFKYKGQQLGLPFDWNNNLTWYNTTVFKKAGVIPPGPNWTGTDFLAVAKKVRATGAFGLNPPAGGIFSVVDWMMAAGGGLLTSDWTKSKSLCVKVRWRAPGA